MGKSTPINSLKKSELSSESDDILRSRRRRKFLFFPFLAMI